MSSCELTQSKVQRSPNTMWDCATTHCFEKTTHIQTQAAKHAHVQTPLLQMLAVVNKHNDVSHL